MRCLASLYLGICYGTDLFIEEFREHCEIVRSSVVEYWDSRTGPTSNNSPHPCSTCRSTAAVGRGRSGSLERRYTVSYTRAESALSTVSRHLSAVSDRQVWAVLISLEFSPGFGHDLAYLRYAYGGERRGQPASSRWSPICTPTFEQLALTRSSIFDLGSVVQVHPLERLEAQAEHFRSPRNGHEPRLLVASG